MSPLRHCGRSVLAQGLFRSLNRGTGCAEWVVAAMPLTQLPCGPAEVCSTSYSATAATIFAVHTPQHAAWGISFVAQYAKATKQKQQEQGSDKQELDMKPVEDSMGAALERLRVELSGIRTGTANPGLLEHLEVESKEHGRHVALRALGTVTARSPQLLAVSVFNKAECQLIAQAIQDSALGLPARVEGGEVLVPVPRLTMDYVQKMARLVAQHGEAAKKVLNGVRHAAIKAAEGVPGGKDDVRQAKATVEKAVAGYKAQVEQMVKAKEKDLKENH